ncbi:hypothetical protein GNI_025600 [Gregarina niphandrodes]|uniref:Uncharacterized protein n=1 Tax=Gregarina niphandrodes TaxID=110365 RepID=A0A023BBK5_GRENI|nr:hypothetical protein GNI_025600 [Gregarina niphandrodes]EZG79522.1 hypothetical protein GNI_025600 [Gregarina niphandrodes]|eukprot:XP_011134419.1 hypothetical protein GNI_025600 [Gregarina niphandrodes]
MDTESMLLDMAEKRVVSNTMNNQSLAMTRNGPGLLAQGRVVIPGKYTANQEAFFQSRGRIGASGDRSKTVEIYHTGNSIQEFKELAMGMAALLVNQEYGSSLANAEALIPVADFVCLVFACLPGSIRGSFETTRISSKVADQWFREYRKLTSNIISQKEITRCKNIATSAAQRNPLHTGYFTRGLPGWNGGKGGIPFSLFTRLTENIIPCSSVEREKGVPISDNYKRRKQTRQEVQQEKRVNDKKSKVFNSKKPFTDIKNRLGHLADIFGPKTSGGGGRISKKSTVAQQIDELQNDWMLIKAFGLDEAQHSAVKLGEAGTRFETTLQMGIAGMWIMTMCIRVMKAMERSPILNPSGVSIGRTRARIDYHVQETIEEGTDIEMAYITSTVLYNMSKQLEPFLDYFATVCAKTNEDYESFADLIKKSQVQKSYPWLRYLTVVKALSNPSCPDIHTVKIAHNLITGDLEVDLRELQITNLHGLDELRKTWEPDTDKYTIRLDRIPEHGQPLESYIQEVVGQAKRIMTGSRTDLKKTGKKGTGKKG